MNKIIFLAVVMWASALAGVASAQPAIPKTAAKKAATTIDSSSAEFDLNGGLAIYHGQVVVIDPQMKLECDQLVVFIPKAGERLNRIEAQTNVVIHFADSRGSAATARGALAVYRFTVENGATNETVTLTGTPETGNPKVESEQGTLTGDAITWDRTNNKLSATNQRMMFNQNLNQSLGSNAAPVKLF